MTYETGFMQELRRLVEKEGGAINYHAHLDRASTLKKEYLEHAGIDPMKASALPLAAKQNLTGELHKGKAYESENLKERMSEILKASAELGIRKLYSLIDTTADIGIRAFDVALGLKDEMSNEIEFLVASYPIFGFKDSEPERWEIFEEASRKADFLGALPERDERKDHIGYKDHLRRILHLAAELDKPVQVHVDQANDPNEKGTEELIHAVNYCIPPEMRIKEGEPLIWAVHSISPSAYDESRFLDLLDAMHETQIGVICCPSAAISMKQKRKISVPTHNSIPRVLEMLAHEIPVRLGSDNIADVFMPTGTPDMCLETFRLCDYTRFYMLEIWTKVLAGKKLNETDRHSIREYLDDGA